MKEQSISIFLSIFIFLLGIILELLFKPGISVVESILFGMTTYVVSILAFMEVKIRKLDSYETLEKNVTYAAQSLRTKESTLIKGTSLFDYFYETCLLRAKEGYYEWNNSEHLSFKIEKQKIPDFWLQAILNTELTWFCTNYINLEIDWKTNWTKHGLEMQKFLVHHKNVKIRRIFIFDDASEISEDAIETMKYQSSIGIEVRWICINSHKTHWAPFRKFTQLINTFDIAIVNSKYLIAFDLDKNRVHTGLRIFCEPIIVGKVDNLYSRLWEESKELDDLNT